MNLPTTDRRHTAMQVIHKPSMAVSFIPYFPCGNFFQIHACKYTTAYPKRDNEDERTLGELFYLMIAEVADITYHESMQIIVEAMLATIQEEFHITDEQVNAFYEKFMTKLPESMQHLLRAA